MASRTKGKTVMEVGSDGVAVITLINPPVNSLSFDVLYDLKSNYEEALSRNDVKAIVITGAKGKFSGGFDISGFGEMQKGTSMFHCLCIFGDFLREGAKGNSLEYEIGARNFVAGASSSLSNPTEMFCPCVDCRNVCHQLIETVLDHLVIRGMDENNIQRQQKLQISLKYNYNNNSVVQDEIPKQNLVSTGLRLSNDDDERNSSVTSANGSITTPVFQSLGDNIRLNLDRPKDELDQFFKFQADQMAKGMRDIKQRHVTTFVTALEKGVSKKLQEKDQEIESMNKKNRELMEKIKQVAGEAQNWHYKAKYNESVVNALKVSVLLVPCRHLSLCRVVGIACMCAIIF